MRLFATLCGLFLMLFSANRGVRENVAILGMLYVLGVFWGIVLMAPGL